MNAEQLKASILQQAIEGKLVPQLDSEPAVERIGKTPEDVPFEIPEKWKWVKLEDVAKFVATGPFGSVIHKSDYVQNGVPLVNPMHMVKGRIVPSDGARISAELAKQLSSYRLSSGDIVIARRGELGRCALVSSVEEGWLCGTGSFFLHLKDDLILSEYFIKLFRSEYVTKQLNSKSVGTTIANLNHRILKSCLLPLPSISEQRRIVARLKELLPLVEEYGKHQSALEKLEKEFPDKLKASILQQAIEGKLVPQLDSEPAVEQIGKAPEDVPFEIPEKWKWVFLPKLSSITYGYPFESHMFNTEGRGKSLIRIRDILDGVSKTYTTELAPDAYNINNGDMLVGMDGNFNVNFWKGGPAWLNQRVCKIEAKDECADQYYLFYFLPFALKQEQDSVSYTTVKHLSAKALSAMPVPLPPLGEQRRIVARIKELFELIDSYTKSTEVR